jgi:hypothetical protein
MEKGLAVTMVDRAGDLSGRQEMNNLRKRAHRRAGCQIEGTVETSQTSDRYHVAEKAQPIEAKDKAARSRMSILTEIAQLALDLIKVAREGVDLYHKVRFEK